MPSDATRRPVATVVLPAFNEERALPVVLEGLAPLRADGLEVVVVDDGSRDRTAEVGREAGVKVVRLERNSGKAAAVRAGLEAASGSRIVVMDADATYPPEAIPEMVRLLDEHDIVIGARIRGREHIPAFNRLGNGLLRTAVHWFSGFRSADPLTGLYALRREHLEAMRLDSQGFGLEVEIGVKAARMGLRAIDYPITYRERIGESKLNAVRDGMVITSTLVRTLFGRPRLRPLPGRDGVPAAPLAVVATTLSVVLLTAAAVLLAGSTVAAVAAIVDPAFPFTLAPARPGIAALFAGLLSWRISTHWGRPPPRSMLRLGAAAVAGGAALVALAAVVAERVGLVPADPRYATTIDLTVATAIVVAVGALAVLALAPAWWRSDRAREAAHRLRRWLARYAEPIGLAAALLVLALPVARFIGLGQILGFDEAVYASTARAMVLDTPNTAWVSHRAPGISVMAAPFAWLESDAALRLVGLAFGVACVVAGWALARRIAGAAAGVIAALLIAAVPDLQLNSALFLTDVPSAALFIALMLLAWSQLEERTAPGRAFLWLAPLAALTFYVRYGAAIPIALLAVTALVLWRRKVFAAWRLTLATTALLLVLLVPHLVQSVALHGDPLAIVLSSQEGAAPAYPGEALAFYLQSIPPAMGGVVGAWFLVLGVVAWPIRVVVQGLDHRSVRAHTLLLVPAIGQFVLLGLVALPQVRYVLLPIALVLIAGAITAVDLGHALSRAWRRSLAAGLVVATVVSGIGAGAVMVRLQAEHTPVLAPLADAARFIRDDAAGRSCSVLGYPPPELVWYSGCEAHHFGDTPQAGRERSLDGERRYMMLSAAASDREPAGALRERYLSLADPEPIHVVPSRLTGDPAIEIYLLR